MANWKDDLNYGLAAFGIQLPETMPSFFEELERHPQRSIAAVVAVSGVLFFYAERGHNEKVQSVYDAMVYTSTCLNVGYGDIFAKTPLGKTIGTILMTYGPALAGRALDRPAKDGMPSGDITQQQMLATLKAILAKLPDNAAGAASAGTPTATPSRLEGI
jgi:hypothetical protein